MFEQRYRSAKRVVGFKEPLVDKRMDTDTSEKLVIRRHEFSERLSGSSNFRELDRSPLHLRSVLPLQLHMPCAVNNKRTYQATWNKDMYGGERKDESVIDGNPFNYCKHHSDLNCLARNYAASLFVCQMLRQ